MYIADSETLNQLGPIGSLARAAAMYAAPRHEGLNEIKRRASGVGSAELPCALQTVSETIICYNTTSVNCWETVIFCT